VCGRAAFSAPEGRTPLRATYSYILTDSYILHNADNYLRISCARLSPSYGRAAGAGGAMDGGLTDRRIVCIWRHLWLGVGGSGGGGDGGGACFFLCDARAGHHRNIFLLNQRASCPQAFSMA